MDVIIRKSEINGSATPPPSKSYTHRAFIAASLSGRAEIINPLIAADTLATLNACRKFGAQVIRKSTKDLLFRGVDEVNADGYFYFANSGTTLRFFLSLLSLSTSPKFSIADGDESLRKRPNRELAEAIKNLGGGVYGGDDYKAPLKIRGVLKGGSVSMNALSSQFVSSLLFSLPMAEWDSTVRILNVKSKPYIDITLDVLEKSGVKVDEEEGEYNIEGGQRFKLRKFTIPADFSSASYLIAAALISGKIRLSNVYESKQGDARIVDICREMGAKIMWRKEKGILEVEKSDLHGVDVDASDIPDLVPAIAVLAAVADGVTRIRNAEHLRIKEIDRIEGISRNLASLGVDVEVLDDGLIIKGGKREFAGTVDSFGDHRMALSFSLLGLLGEVKCRNAEVVSVSYPEFFDVLKMLGGDVEIINF